MKIEDVQIKDTQLDSLKEKIKCLLEPVKDINVVYDLLTILQKPILEDELKQILEKKKILYYDDILSVIIDISAPFEEKEEFISLLYKGIINYDKFNIKRKNNIFETFDYNTFFIREFAKKILKYKPNIGIGAGEIFFILFLKNAQYSHIGDVRLKDELFEIKTTSKNGGRLKGRDKWINTVSIYPQFASEMKKIINDDFSNPNKWNLNQKALQNYNKHINSKNYKNIKNILKKHLNCIFINAELNEFQWIDKVITKNGIFIEEFIIEFAGFQFDYYRKNTEPFDKLIVINSESGNYIIFENSEDLKNAIRNKDIVLPTGFSWKDENGNAYRLEIR